MTLARHSLIALGLTLFLTFGQETVAAGVFPGATWEKVTPESQGVDAGKLEETISQFKANSGSDGVKELVVVYNGRVIWEGEASNKVHGVWSVTKSFTSTCLGLLIDDGKCTVDTPAMKFVPALAESYPDVTLRHFATMTSGYRAKGDEPRGSYAHGPSLTPFLPDTNRLFAPGTQFRYWDSAMNEFANVLTQIAGEPLDELFKRRIADPIGMDPTEWRWGDFGEENGIRVNGGSGNNNRHIFISSRQIARLGLLFLHRGNWNGRQLISADWVEQATSPQVPATASGGRRGRTSNYGFNWWVNRRGGDELAWPELPKGAFAAQGAMNNRLYVVPEWNLVVARLALEKNNQRIGSDVWNGLVQGIGASLPESQP